MTQSSLGVDSIETVGEGKEKEELGEYLCLLSGSCLARRLKIVIVQMVTKSLFFLKRFINIC